MTKCYYCDKEITQKNTSEEHIIPSCISGILTSKELLCKPCNDITGTNIDSGLAKQTEFIMYRLMLKTSRGDLKDWRAETVSGKKFDIDKNRITKPIAEKPEITQNGNLVTINIDAPDMRTARQALNGIKRKYPTLDVEQVLSTAQYKKEFLDEPYHYKISIGGEELFLPILKIAIEFYLNAGYSSTHIADAISALKSNITSGFIDQYINKPDIHIPLENEISHILFLKGDSTHKKIYGFIDLFNCIVGAVKLSDNYLGEDFEISYKFDLINRQKIGLKLDWQFTYDDFINHIFVAPYDTNVNLERYNRMMKIGEERYRQFIIKQALDPVFKKYSNEPYITPEMANEIAKEASAAMAEYIIALNSATQFGNSNKDG